ncbi:MAG: U32 family peptidase C-terminal domain-containing protein, partial [Clostridia bacterium]|nr:U32 family peptidase C-terminal domain-containing protein [Clostridia bacterium]
NTALIEMRNRFLIGDVLEVLSPNEYFNKTIKVERLTAVDGTPVADAKIVQQKLLLKTNIRLHAGDVLRK